MTELFASIGSPPVDLNVFDCVRAILAHYSQAFTPALVISSLGAYPIYRILLALKSRQTVSQYAPEGHQKKQGTPTMGGLIVVFGFLSVLLLSYNRILISTYQFGSILPVFWLVLGFSTIGFVDDFVVPRLIKGKRGLGWKQKILLQLVLAYVCAFKLYDATSMETIFMVFTILFFSNAYNFADGLDWLAGSLLIGLSIGLMFIAGLAGVADVVPYLTALLGALIPFMVLNKPKAKIFMGDVGSLPIGALLGLCVALILFPVTSSGDFGNSFGLDTAGILSHREFPVMGTMPFKLVCLFIVSGMMIVELVPVPLQIASVKLRKKKLFSFTPIHHAFERKGWPEGKVVAVFAGCQALLSAVAIAIALVGANQFRYDPSQHESREFSTRGQPLPLHIPFGVDQGLSRATAPPIGKGPSR